MEEETNWFTILDRTFTYKPEPFIDYTFSELDFFVKRYGSTLFRGETYIFALIEHYHREKLIRKRVKIMRNSFITNPEKFKLL